MSRGLGRELWCRAAREAQGTHLAVALDAEDLQVDVATCHSEVSLSAWLRC